MQERGGSSYFMQGFELIRTKGLKRFVLVPLFINVLLFSTAFYFILDYIQLGVDYVIGLIPDFLGWLKTALVYLLWPIAVISVLLIFALIFGTLANWIAAPFNGLLSEKVERHLTGQDLGNEGFVDLLKDVPRILGREWRKLAYYIPRALFCLILLFMLPVIGQAIWFFFGAWMMAVQYCDYPFDNHKVDFVPMRQLLKEDRLKNVSFGFCVSVMSFIPLLNLIVMPVSVCGATALFVDRYRNTGRVSA